MDKLLIFLIYSERYFNDNTRDFDNSKDIDLKIFLNITFFIDYELDINTRIKYIYSDCFRLF